MKTSHNKNLDEPLAAMVERAKAAYIAFENALKTGDRDAITFAFWTFANKYLAFAEVVYRADFPDKEFYSVLRDFGASQERDGRNLAQWCKARADKL